MISRLFGINPTFHAFNHLFIALLYFRLSALSLILFVNPDLIQALFDDRQDFIGGGSTADDVDDLVNVSRFTVPNRVDKALYKVPIILQLLLRPLGGDLTTFVGKLVVDALAAVSSAL